MKRRKMFLATLLIILIVFQSVLPFTTVNATTFDVVITSSSELFTALTKELTEKNVDAYYDYANFRIFTYQAEIEKITELNLSNAEIDDLTGLGKFTSVTKLNLTSNELTVDSNLAELDKLPLTNLNLSSNEIESVSSITKFDSIAYTDITNQQVEKREIIELDVSEKASNVQKYTINLPDILLKDTGMIKEGWLDAETSDGCLASVNWASINPTQTTCELIVAAGVGENYHPYKGLLKLTVKVDDSSSKLYNTNMTLYYVIIDSTETGICFEDNNLYKAVKEQLTAGQEENDELLSYGEDGTTLYKASYDEAKVLVIDTNVLINDIPSLKLNDKKIEDLTGLEEFIGLESTLDISYNYIDSIEKVLELEENKEAKEAILLANYKEALAKLTENRTKLQESKTKLEEINKKIDEIYSQINELDTTATDYQSKYDSLMNQLNESKTGLLAQKATELRNIEMYEGLVAEGLKKLYSIYENEYRLTTILPVSVYDLSYMDIYYMDLETAKSSTYSIMDKVSKLEKDGALSAREKQLIVRTFNISTSTTVQQDDGKGNITTKTIEIENPISAYFEEFKAYEDYNTLSDYQDFINEFKKVDVAVTVMNYCLIEYMNSGVLDCTCDEGLEDLFEFYEENGFDTVYLSDYMYGTHIIECTANYTANDRDAEYQLSGHFTNLTDEELEKFIVLPRIKYLNMTDNKLETLAGIEELDNLLGLYVYKNLLGDINDVAWEKLTSLKELDLGYNQLSDVKALEVLKELTAFSVSKNLLSGNFDFYLAGMNNLVYADFSYNQYSNISYLLDQYAFIAKSYGFDNVGDFLVNSLYAPVISFQYQTLSMNATIIREGDLTRLQLPKIFEQCEELDYLRTSFGETSLNGTVLADGTEVLLRTPKEGEYKACVVIDGHNGNEYTEDGIGFGTTCTIDYTVIKEIELPEVPEDSGNQGNTGNENSGNTGNEDNTNNQGSTEDVEYGYTVDDTMVLVNTPEITVKTFKQNLVSGDYTVTVLNENREAVSDTTILRTGYVVSIDKNGENVENFEVIVKGDVNGDGEVDALDTGLVRQVINNTKELVGVYAIAADVNSDGEIDSMDSAQILKYRAAKINAFAN